MPKNIEEDKCPFCGSDNLDYGISDPQDGDTRTWPVHCNECGKDFERVDAEVFQCYQYFDENDELVELRPEPDKLTAKAQEMAELLREFVDWYHEAPVAEIEAVEDAIEKRPPIASAEALLETLEGETK